MPTRSSVAGRGASPTSRARNASVSMACLCSRKPSAGGATTGWLLSMWSGRAPNSYGPIMVPKPLPSSSAHRAEVETITAEPTSPASEGSWRLGRAV